MRKFSFDILGDIAILKFPEISMREKKKLAVEFLKKNKSVKTILEKSERVKGRLRIAKTRFLAGENKKETIYTENECRFKISVDETYFSPRLAHQRQIVAEEIAEKVTKKKNKILVMFAGIAPFPIVIAKKLKKAGKKAELISSEINRKASGYAGENVRLNKMQDYVKVVQGDSKKLPVNLGRLKFDFIVMPRPNLKETFLKQAFMLSKKYTRIYYYGFCGCSDEEQAKLIGQIQKEAKKYKKKIKILGKKVAGAVAPYKIRLRVDFKVLNN